MYGMKVTDLFTCGCLTFPTPLPKETVFSLLYILASFVES